MHSTTSFLRSSFTDSYRECTSDVAEMTIKNYRCRCKFFHLFLFKNEVLAEDVVDGGHHGVMREQQVPRVWIFRG